ncbi:MAG: electron transfer flavoprotein subunit alpha/FixB family protein [Candidatus Sericytochromatia bacterium]|nr:electron transfer flavoprotein subunit alpha/FixB family protein [Candidatus Sericytochromatia bacterium]
MDLSDLAFLMGGDLPEAAGDDWRGIWVVAEPAETGVTRGSRQAIAKARELGDRLGTRVDAVLLGGSEAAAEALGQLGADTVYLADDAGFAGSNADAWVAALAELVTEKRPEIVLMPFSSRGREVAPRLAQRLATGLVADATALDLDESERLLVATRQSFGGRSLASVTCPQARPQMATLHPNAFREGELDHGRSCELVRLSLSPAGSRVQLLGQTPLPERVPLERARVVICGGKGLGGTAGAGLVAELAALLGGQVAGTRGAVEAGYIAAEQEVSGRGATIAPDLYIGVGVGGSMDHTDAMRQSRTIVAINQDAEAPLMGLADVAVVGDLHELVPALIAAIKAARARQQPISTR